MGVSTMYEELTPCAMHHYDMMYHTSMNKFTYTDPNSGMILTYDPECNLAKDCPKLYYLFFDAIIVLDKEYGKRIRPYLKKFEKILVRIQDEIRRRGVIDNSTLKTQDEQIVLSWYNGFLSPSPGYDMQKNNEVFAQYIVSRMLQG